MDLEKELHTIKQSEHDLFLVQKYKNGEVTLEEVSALKVSLTDGRNRFVYRPDLTRFYEYILLEEGALNKGKCIKIYRVFVTERDDSDGFFSVVKDNLEHPNVQKLIRSCAKTEAMDQDCLGFIHGYVENFLLYFYEELELEHIKTSSTYLNECNVTYSKQIDLYLFKKAQLDDDSYEKVKLLAELGNLNLDEIASRHASLYNYLFFISEQESV